MDYKEFFSFTQQERRGIIVFLVLAVVIIFGVELYSDFDQYPSEDVSKYYLPEDSISLLEEGRDDYSYQNDLWDDSYQKTPIKKQRFEFDPNTISADSLLLLGFSKFGVKNLVNFRNKGGKIKDIQKFKTIYGIDTTLVNSLGDLITYQSVQQKTFAEYDKSKPFLPFPEKVQEIVELNQADSVQLDDIKGVGLYTVKKILQYRKKLGGYLYKEQLTELNIIKDSLYQQISPFLSVDPSLIKKININTADFKTFIAHPYFASETINAILKYRKQHGNFSDVRHISRIRSLKEETGAKILPYLSVGGEK
ncbi:MAG: helix-hairpin-helix domain-containing protein [Saprospiraceae bacterium]|nr:helix-hairpin-helix domain-containing protein [Saprospiraceae bacterium]